MTTNQIETLAIVSVLINVALLCFIVWYNRMLQKEVEPNDSEKIYKGPDVDERSYYEVLSDIRWATWADPKIMFFTIGQIHSSGRATITEFRVFASLGIPIFQWYSNYFQIPIESVKDMTFITSDDFDKMVRSETGPGKPFYGLSKTNVKSIGSVILSELDAEAYSIWEDELIRAGILPVPCKTDVRKNGSVKS